MMFTNVLKEDKNYNALKDALVNWVLGLDKEDGATCQVLDCIPYSMEMNDILPWDKVDKEIDTAIGGRGNWGDKIADILLVGRNEDIASSLRLDFDDFICKKALAIVNAYDKIINRLNELSAKTKIVIVKKFVGLDENKVAQYAVVKKFVHNTYLEGIDDVWDYIKGGKTEIGWLFTEFVDAMYTGNSVAIADGLHAEFVK